MLFAIRQGDKIKFKHRNSYDTFKDLNGTRHLQNLAKAGVTYDVISRNMQEGRECLTIRLGKVMVSDVVLL